ncbi:MAG: hypothetical protein ACE5OZ_18950 [Candidatus Heimdallarchaeota archaeon]
MNRSNEKWVESKLRRLLVACIGFLAANIGIYFPLILSGLDENYAVEIGGVNLALVFLFGAPLVGHSLGDLVRSDNDLAAYYKDFGYVFLGALLGFLGALALGLLFESFSEKEVRFYFILGLFGGALMAVFFLANIADFIKNKELSEDRLEAVLRSVGIIGIYQYLFSAYTDALIPFIGNNPDIDPLIGICKTSQYKMQKAIAGTQIRVE